MSRRFGEAFLYAIVWFVLSVLTIGLTAAVLHAREKSSKFAIVTVDLSPVRGEVKPLRLRRTGFTYKCSECHKSFETVRRSERLVAEHTDLELDHGSNDYCLNCHHPTNRNVYVDHDGSEIPADEPARLCGKCHGPVYRDWRNGVHGRRTGFWNLTMGSSKRLLCIQCHDPHKPKFGSLAPLPGPRVGHVSGGHEAELEAREEKGRE